MVVKGARDQLHRTSDGRGLRFQSNSETVGCLHWGGVLDHRLAQPFAFSDLIDCVEREGVDVRLVKATSVSGGEDRDDGLGEVIVLGFSGVVHLAGRHHGEVLSSAELLEGAQRRARQET